MGRSVVLVTGASEGIGRAPARYHVVGTGKWHARLSRVLPPSSVESLRVRHSGLSK